MVMGWGYRLPAGGAAAGGAGVADGVLKERGGEWARADAMPGTELMGGGVQKVTHPFIQIIAPN